MRIISSISSSEFKELVHFCKKILYFFPILALIIGTNYYVDPACQYSRKKIVEIAAKILSEGKNVNLGNTDNFNERIFQKKLINSINSGYETIVLGSSRSMQIGSSLFKNTSFMNNSVSSATLEDFLGIFYNYESRGFLPKKLILCVDPWIFNINSSLKNWSSISNDVFNMFKILKYEPKYINKNKENAWGENLVSLSYFQASIRAFINSSLLNKIKEELPFETLDSEDSKSLIILKDGKKSYNKKFRSKNLNEVKMEAITYGNTKGIYGFEDFTSNNNELLLVFEKFIHHLLDKKIQITVFLSPFHPETYKLFQKRDDMKVALDVEQVLQKIAKKNGIAIIGSYDPNKYKLGENDFFDGVHLKDFGVEKIFSSNKIKQGHSPKVVAVPLEN